MLKKTLVRLTIVTAVALGTGGVANASNLPGPYIGGQLGWGNTHTSLGDLKGNENIKSDVAAVNSFSWDSLSVSTRSDSTGLAGRLFLGYQFSPNFAAEFGYAKFHDANIKGNYVGQEVFSPTDTDTLNYSYKGTSKVHAFDLVGKGIAPLGGNFSAFAKLGIAYVQQTNTLKDTYSVSSTDSDLNIPTTTINSYKQHNNRFMPVGGVGISYDITPNVPVDVSWMHYQKVGGNIPNMDLLALGVAYKFND